MNTYIVTELTMQELEEMVNTVFPKANYKYESSNLSVGEVKINKYAEITREDFPRTIQDTPETVVKLLGMLAKGTDQKWMDIIVLEYLVWLRLLPEGRFRVITWAKRIK